MGHARVWEWCNQDSGWRSTKSYHMPRWQPALVAAVVTVADKGQRVNQSQVMENLNATLRVLAVLLQSPRICTRCRHCLSSDFSYICGEQLSCTWPEPHTPPPAPAEFPHFSAPQAFPRFPQLFPGKPRAQPSSQKPVNTYAQVPTLYRGACLRHIGDEFLGETPWDQASFAH